MNFSRFVTIPREIFPPGMKECDSALAIVRGSRARWRAAPNMTSEIFDHVWRFSCHPMPPNSRHTEPGRPPCPGPSGIHGTCVGRCCATWNPWPNSLAKRHEIFYRAGSQPTKNLTPRRKQISEIDNDPRTIPQLCWK